MVDVYCQVSHNRPAEPVGSLKWMQAIHDFVQDSQPKKPKP